MSLAIFQGLVPVFLRPGVAFVALFSVAAVARVAYLLTMAPSLEGYHWAIADDLLSKGIFGYGGVETAYYEPLYPLFLAVARRIVGDSQLVVQVLQAFVDSLGAALLFLLVTALTARRQVAAIAALLYALYPLLVRHAVLLHEYSLVSVFLVAFCYLVVTANTMSRAAAAGVCLGSAILIRAMVAPALAFTTLALILTRRYRIAVAVALTTTAVTAPWLVRNHLLNGAIAPTRSGVSFFMGNSRYAAALFPTHNIDLLMQFTDSIPARERPDLLVPAAEYSLDAFYWDLAWEEIGTRPLETVALKFRYLAYFFWPRLMPSQIMTADTTITLGVDGAIQVRDSLPRPIVDEIAYSSSYILVLVTALAGVWRRRHVLMKDDAVLWCVLVTFVAVHVAYYPATVYRVPVEFVLLFYAAVGLEWAYQALSNRQRSSTAGLTT
jgi:Dolichyl-phosphate-mannose-protein mannosyltransferase